jgi:hypothetical protein
MRAKLALGRCTCDDFHLQTANSVLGDSASLAKLTERFVDVR